MVQDFVRTSYILKPIDIRQLKGLFLTLKKRLDQDRRIEALLHGATDLEKQYSEEIISAIESKGNTGFLDKAASLSLDLKQFSQEDALHVYRKIFRSVAQHFQFPQVNFPLDQVNVRSLSLEKLSELFRQDMEKELRHICARTEQTALLLCFRAQEEIRRSYMDSQLSLKNIAQKLNVSYGYLSGIFTEQAGISMKSYLIQVRMEKAWELLLQRKYKIFEIALQVGYTNTRYFSDAFRKYYGVSPTQKLESLHQTLSGTDGGAKS